ncbi:MAG: response regulator [Geminocystis sp.]|nr:response regulator [Geminocystis sp.]
MRILLVEDDIRLSKIIRDCLLPEAEVVDVLEEGGSVLDTVKKKDYDVVILDVLLPEKNGIDVCRELRRNEIEVGILLITALNNKKDKIKAFEAGADDYLLKPFDFQELILRVKALVRRNKKSKPQGEILTYGKLKLDPATRTVKFGEEELTLTRTEYHILKLFLEHPLQILEQDKIINELWEIDATPTATTLRSHIKSLRKKLQQAGLDRDFIQTVYGVGYRLKPSPPEEKQDNNTNDNSQQKLGLAIQQLWLQHQQDVIQDCQTLSLYIQGKHPHLSHQEAIRITHNLVGFLGSLGFTEASEICRQIENILKANQETITPQASRQILQLLTQLQATLFPTQDITAETTITSFPQSPSPTSKPQTYEILVVDENQKIANQLILFVEDPNVNFRFAHTPETAIDYVTRENFHVVILETFWQKVEGDVKAINDSILSTLARKQNTTPVVVYTQDDSIENRLYCSAYPISAFLSKENPIPTLWQQVENCLEKNKAVEKKHKILLIDDDKRFVDVLSYKLKTSGLPLEVDAMVDSEGFLDKIRKIKPDLMIVDVQMPKLSGLDICRIVKKDPMLSRIPFIFLTGNLTPSLVSQLIKAGGDDFISKSKMDVELYPRIVAQLRHLS